MYVTYETFRAALDKADFPEALREYLSEERLLKTARQSQTAVPFIRSAGPRSAPVWCANALKLWVYRKYNRAAPVACSQFIAALDELCRREQIDRANARDRKAAGKR